MASFVDGSAFDLTDADTDIESFEQYIYNCMLQSYDHRQYLLTVDYNRSEFSYAV